jgi:hypothetical protein
VAGCFSAEFSEPYQKLSCKGNAIMDSSAKTDHSYISGKIEYSRFLSFLYTIESVDSFEFNSMMIIDQIANIQDHCVYGPA